jgi:hypothetical protein
MRKVTLALAMSLFIGSAVTPTAMAQSVSPAITQEAAHAIGVDAYVYLYPLVSMDITRKQTRRWRHGG